MQGQIRRAITEALEALGMKPIDFSVEHPGDLSHGDYASNVAMVAAKQAGEKRILGASQEVVDNFDRTVRSRGTASQDLLRYFRSEANGNSQKVYSSCKGETVIQPEQHRYGENPRECAQRILAALEKNTPAEVEKIEIAGPGFINFYLSRAFFARQVQEAIEKGDEWGRNDVYAGKRVMVEYTDPNPFKELHIGHLVPNAIGESIARLFMFAGAETKRVTYQGDVGMHVAKAIRGAQILGMTLEEKWTGAKLGNAYTKGAEIFGGDSKEVAEITRINKAIYERTDPEINAQYDKGKAASLEDFEEAYEVLGSKFERNFFESETAPLGLTAVRAHPEIFEMSQGAVIFNGEKYGLHTRVFINSEGLATYEAKDIGLLQKKQEWWPFDHSITVTATEQKNYFEVTMKAVELVYPELAVKTEIILVGMLKLPTGKMSSRTGTIIPALRLINDVQRKVLERMRGSGLENKETVARDVAVGAIKYAILRSGAGKDIVFDIEQSISLEGASGPYLQYTHARLCSILEKAGKEGVKTSCEVSPEETYEIERKLSHFGEVAERAVLEREPHYVVTYLTELAGAFNSWYGKEQIVNKDDIYSPYKVAVAQAVAQTLKNGLWTLGIKAPEKM